MSTRILPTRQGRAAAAAAGYRVHKLGPARYTLTGSPSDDPYRDALQVTGHGGTATNESDCWTEAIMRMAVEIVPTVYRTPDRTDVVDAAGRIVQTYPDGDAARRAWARRRGYVFDAEQRAHA